MEKGRAKVELEQLSKEDLQEMALIEMAYQILEQKKQPMPFNELVEELGKLSGASEEEIKERVAQFYTELNIDGRFINVGGNTWGLKGWYRLNNTKMTSSRLSVRRRRKVKSAGRDEFDDEDYELDDEDLELDDIDEDDIDDEDEDYEDVDEDMEDIDGEYDDDLIDDDDEALMLDEDIDLDDEMLDDVEDDEE